MTIVNFHGLGLRLRTATPCNPAAVSPALTVWRHIPSRAVINSRQEPTFPRQFFDAGRRFSRIARRRRLMPPGVTQPASAPGQDDLPQGRGFRSHNCRAISRADIGAEKWKGFAMYWPLN